MGSQSHQTQRGPDYKSGFGSLHGDNGDRSLTSASHEGLTGFLLQGDPSMAEGARQTLLSVLERSFQSGGRVWESRLLSLL